LKVTCPCMQGRYALSTPSQQILIVGLTNRAHWSPSIAQMLAQIPKLPWELLEEEVICHLDTSRDRKTLKALAQTCHTFVWPSRRILLEELSWGGEEKDWIHTCDLISTTPHLASYVRCVRIRANLETDEDQLYKIQLVLDQLRHIETLELSSSLSPLSLYLLCAHVWENMKMRDSIHRLIRGAPLKRLILKNVNIHLFNLAPSSIDTLQIRVSDISVDEDSASGSTHLKKIEMQWSEDSSTRSLETVPPFAKNLCSCTVTVDGKCSISLLLHLPLGNSCPT